jgi:enoyl reductase-like protein/3-oxoacyl-ACP reductase-like protein/3-oxoacyl-(acyl-carrier-protein) synthase/acyl dehydratase
MKRVDTKKAAPPSKPNRAVKKRTGTGKSKAVQARVSDVSAASKLPAARSGSWIENLVAGRASAVLTFAGNGPAWLDELAAVWSSTPAAREVISVAAAALQVLAKQDAFRFSGLCGHGVEIMQWLQRPETRPSAAYLSSSAVSQPGVFVTQVARFIEAHQTGLGKVIEAGGIIAAAGHSQGIMAAILVSESASRTANAQIAPDRCAEFAQYLAWQGLWMARSWHSSPASTAPGAPMAAVVGLDHDRLAAHVTYVNNHSSGAPIIIALHNSRTRFVLGGSGDALEALHKHMDAVAKRELQARKEGRFGGSPLSFEWEDMPFESPFHTEHMDAGVVEMLAAMQSFGLQIDVNELAFDVFCTATGAPVGTTLTKGQTLVDRVIRLQFREPVRWTRVVTAIAATDCDLVIDCGPGPGIQRVTAAGLRGHGIDSVALAEPSGRRALFADDLRGRRLPTPYAAFAPTLQRLPDGNLAVDNHYTRATGQAPVILPGMTPTTVDVPICAAAANAGFTAEIAGGGQVTPQMWSERVKELGEALAPGREVVFNALYLDRYLWDLHLGAKKLVQKARRAGAPICGVTISAGIPETDEAVALLDEFAAEGMWLNAFKPGTVAQIDRVLQIAAAASQHLVFMHLEGGKAGGHHSWEDLDQLLIARYDKIRHARNVVLCVGGGIADEQRAVELLTGRWSHPHGLVAMPVDAVFLGTVAMACKEATASAQVKHALATAQGTDRWVHAGEAAGGVTSGKSQLNADIHYIDNAAARCGRLLDSVAGDAEAVAARRDEIVAALNKTAKPWFGDLGTMTWAAVLERMVALMAVGKGGRYEDGVWPDVSYRQRVADMIRRAEARLGSGEQTRPSILVDLADLDAPDQVLQRLTKSLPAVLQARLLPMDIEHFAKSVCARPGKPVNFVPLIDADVRRWYKSDSLWQAQDSRYDADAVLIIPGPEAVKGIVADEPVADLLGRFTQALVADLQQHDAACADAEFVQRAERLLPIPGAIRVERGGDVTTWRVAAPAAANCWFAPLASRLSGPLARLFGATRTFCDGRIEPNIVHALCPAAPGATLWIEDADGACTALTWRADGAANEAIYLAVRDDNRIEVVVRLPELAGSKAARDWTECFAVDADGFCHRDTPDGGAIRDFYHHNLFGGPIEATPLFAKVGAQVVASERQLNGYAALSGDARTAPASICFSLAFRPIMSALSCDELAPGLLRLVHLDNKVEVLGGWPLRDGHKVDVSTAITRVEATVDGLLIVAQSELSRAGLACAQMRSRFLMRGFDNGILLAANEPVHAVIQIQDEAELAFVKSHAWLCTSKSAAAGFSVGQSLEIEALACIEQGPQGTRRFEATGAVSCDGEQVGTLELLATGTGAHPLRALLDTLGKDATVATPRRQLAVQRCRATADIEAWALISDDLNPIHRSGGIARLAGLPGPIVHGMWTAARAHSFAITALAGGDERRVHSFEASFTAPLFADEPIVLTATRTALFGGVTHCEIAVTAAREVAGTVTQTPVLRAVCEIAPPRTAYVLPGQGIQQQGMGMDGYARSAAARSVWDRADVFTRAELGFSLLEVVRDNPKQLLVAGKLDHHPKGVLHLTQFTQVAMSVLATAQVAELRESGAFAEDAITCGHSVGEYNALSAIAEVLPLESVVEIVWMRGLTMHTCVPRDANGVSGYAMGVIRPHHGGLDEAGALALVERVREETGGFIEIVNFNVRGKQYSTVGDTATLKVLGKRLEALGGPGRKPAWLAVPGIDVPFHSTRLRDGVAAFRATLKARLPARVGYTDLVGRYIPNLVARVFTLDKDFVRAMLDATGAPEVSEILASFDELAKDPEALARALVIELLAFQFASPVRWIETQELLFGAEVDGGMAVEQVIEIGVGYQPTVANMAKQTLAMLRNDAVSVRNLGADTAIVLGRDEQPASPDEEDEQPQDKRDGASVVAAAAGLATAGAGGAAEPVSAVVAAAPTLTPTTATATAKPTDVPFTHRAALHTLLALQARVQPAQIRDGETIDELFGGVSSRRNQVLVDIGVEFGIGAIDGAHEQPLSQLAAEIARRAPSWSAPGEYLGKAWDDAIRRCLGRARASRKELHDRLGERFGIEEGLAGHFFSFLATDTREGDSARGGALGVCASLSASSKGELDAALDTLAGALGGTLGTPLAPLTVAGGGGSAVDAAVVDELQDKILGADGVLMRGIKDMAEQLGHPFAPGLTAPNDDPAAAKAAAQAATLHDEHGAEWADQIAPRFTAAKHVALTSSWAWAQRDVAALYHDVTNGRVSVAQCRDKAANLGRFASDGRCAATAKWYAGQARDGGNKPLAKLLEGIAVGAQLAVPSIVPSRPSLEIAADGTATYREAHDTAPKALQAWLKRMFGKKSATAHVGLGEDRKDKVWRETLALHSDTPLSFAGRTALVTGASPGSIAIELVRHLLLGGARVVITTSSPRPDRIAWYRRLYQDNCAPGAELHIVPFNAASNRDVDALVQWLFAAVSEQDGANVRHIKAPFAPDIVVPFAAIGDMATLDQLGPRAEMALRAMLLSVERLVAGIGAYYRDHGLPARPCHVVLPLSPNHGGFGGDGAYAETKAALEVLANKWRSERDAWAAAMSLCATKIGWVRGTGLMDANDPVAAQLEARTGCHTFSNAEMGWLIASLCSDELRTLATDEPLSADLTGGFGVIEDVRGVVGTIRDDLATQSQHARKVADLLANEAALLGVISEATVLVEPLPQWPKEFPDVVQMSWPKVKASLRDTIVIVGAGEVGPCGSSRTRWAFEVEDRLSAAAVLEMAWLCGLVRYEQGPRGGRWVDTDSGDEVAESAIADTYREQVRSAAGIRWTEPEVAGFDPDALPVLAIAYLDRDFSFAVGSEEEARSFLAADSTNTQIGWDEATDRWLVTRRAGSEIRVPRVAKMSRRILGMLPTGYDMTRFGVPGDMVETVDRTALFNLVATADAFLSAGMTPEELLSHVHPARVASTTGSGIGGARALQRLYSDYLLDRERQNDTVQESLINVTAAYAVQAYVGSYGSMAHPVAACATAAVSLEEGMDKILANRADFVVAGGFDDVSAGGSLGFQDMGATADSGQMTAMGLLPHQMSRANDIRRRGFVEAQGGGTVLLCRGDVAAAMGLPVRGVLAWAGSFSDGLHKSVPAPGMGIVASAMGGKKSPLGRALKTFGLVADDIGVVYKHDTSTGANDPNENAAHDHIQRSLGRTDGNPLFVVSQKTLTGHSKGGAAAWQAIGLCQTLASGKIAPNRNLESVDPAMRKYGHVAFTDRNIDCGQGVLKAGVLTSLGFGHVGAVALVLHPAAFTAMLSKRERKAWATRAEERGRWSSKRRAEVLMSRRPLFERREDKRFTGQAELDMLLDPDARLVLRDRAETRSPGQDAS